MASQKNASVLKRKLKSLDVNDIFAISIISKSRVVKK